MRFMARRAIRLRAFPALGVACIAGQAGVAAVRERQIAGTWRIPYRERQRHGFGARKCQIALGMTGHAGRAAPPLMMAGGAIGRGLKDHFGVPAIGAMATRALETAMRRMIEGRYSGHLTHLDGTARIHERSVAIQTVRTLQCPCVNAVTVRALHEDVCIDPVKDGVGPRPRVAR